MALYNYGRDSYGLIWFDGVQVRPLAYILMALWSYPYIVMALCSYGLNSDGLTWLWPYVVVAYIVMALYSNGLNGWGLI